MAACLITVTGTSGEVLIKYMNGIIPGKIKSGIGEFYIDDTYTDVTYTTLSGDAIASSGCLTINELPFICYHLKWDWYPYMGYNFTMITVDGEDFELSPIVPLDSESYQPLADSINSLETDLIVAVQGYNSTTVLPAYILVVRTVSPTPPTLKAINSNASASIYIEADTGTCVNVGFTDIETCVLT